MEKIQILLKYEYIYDCQGSDETATEYALITVPKYDQSFTMARSILINEKYCKWTHRIILDSIENLTLGL